MSNEELAVQIREGNAAALPLLWEGIRGFVAKYAYSYMLMGSGSNVVDLDDLIQSGYIAMTEAVASYEPGEARFITWLEYSLKTEFAKAMNMRSEKQKKDPLHCAASLSTPVNDAGDGTVLLMDIIPAPDAIEAVERRIYGEQLRRELETLLSTIEEENADVLRLHFYEEKALEEIAQQRGTTTSSVSACKQAGLRDIRKRLNTPQGTRLRAYIEENTNYYGGVGLQRYKETLSSPVELKVIAREKMRGK